MPELSYANRKEPRRNSVTPPLTLSTEGKMTGKATLPTGEGSAFPAGLESGPSTPTSKGAFSTCYGSRGSPPAPRPNSVPPSGPTAGMTRANKGSLTGADETEPI